VWERCRQVRRLEGLEMSKDKDVREVETLRCLGVAYWTQARVGEVVMEYTGKSHVCPNCQSTSCHRSRRNGAVEFFLHHFFFVTPYRCEDCDQRYFRRRSFKDAAKAAVGHTPTGHAAHSA
jgi:hypothetical protein